MLLMPYLSMAILSMPMRRRSRIYVGIHAAIFEDAAIDHARAEHLYPTRALAQPTALSAAFRAAQIHFHARFREGEIRGAEPHLRRACEHLFRELRQHALQVAEGNPLVHDQPFHLMEPWANAWRRRPSGTPVPEREF